MKLYQKPEVRLARKWGRLVVPKECREAWELAMVFVKDRPESPIEGLAWKMTLGSLVQEFPQGLPAWAEFLKAEMKKGELEDE